MYYFDNLEKQKELKIVLDSWLNTPFKHRCGAKGLGCDCIHFAAKVLEELKIITWRKHLVKDYPKDWHLHNTRELLCEAIESELKVEKFDVQSIQNFMNGDLVILHIGQAAAHASILFDDYLYQALVGSGVVKILRYDKTMRRQMKFVYRILI